MVLCLPQDTGSFGSKVFALFEGVEDSFRLKSSFSFFFRVFLGIRSASGERDCRNNLARPFHLSPRKIESREGKRLLAEGKPSAQRPWGLAWVPRNSSLSWLTKQMHASVAVDKP